MCVEGKADTYTADEGRDEGDTRLCARDGLGEAEEKGEVAVDAVIALELAGSLDTLPGGRNLDEDALLLDADGVVERDELLGLGLGRLLVVREARIDLGRDTAGDDLEDLLAEFDELHRPRQVRQPHARKQRWARYGQAGFKSAILTRRSKAAFAWSSILPPFCLPAWTAASIRL